VGPALYFDKLSQKQEILMKSGSLERRKSALKLPYSKLNSFLIVKIVIKLFKT
jgi:hypothetical protein